MGQEPLGLRPIVAAHRFYDGICGGRSSLLSGFQAGSSGQYILNDILDLASDRAHPSKGKRPWLVEP
jgi:hypothetical protein